MVDGNVNVVQFRVLGFLLRPTSSIVAVCLYIRITKLLSEFCTEFCLFFVIWFQNFDTHSITIANTAIERSVFLILFQNVGSRHDHPRSSISVSRDWDSAAALQRSVWCSTISGRDACL